MAQRALSTCLSSAHPETVFWPNFCVMLKILSSEYHTYTCGKIFRMPRSLRLPELERKSSFLDEHYLENLP